MRIKNARGFTLLELLTVFVIVGILAGISVPFLNAMLAYRRSETIRTDLLSLLTFAQESALSGHAYITLCPTQDKLHCTSNWNQPLMVFIASKGASLRDHDQPLLRVTEAISEGKLSYSGFPQDQFLQWTPEGFTNDQNGSFYYCQDKKGWEIIINRIGRTRVVEEVEC